MKCKFSDFVFFVLNACLVNGSAEEVFIANRLVNDCVRRVPSLIGAAQMNLLLLVVITSYGRESILEAR